MANNKGSGATLIEKLSQPVSWKAVMDVMTHEISLGSRQSRGDVHDFADLDYEVERLLEQAEVSAQRRGISVEQVLAEMGLVSDDSLQEDGKPFREQLLHELGWEDAEQADSVQQKVQTMRGTQKLNVNRMDEASTLREVQLMLPALTMDEISIFLHRLSLEKNDLADRLLFCKVLDREQLERVQEALKRDSTIPLWRLVIAAGGELEQLVDVMQTEPWFPLLHDEKGDFAEHLLEVGLISYRQLKEHMRERQETEEPTLELLGKLLDEEVELHQLLGDFFDISVMSSLEFPVFAGTIPSSMATFFQVFAAVPLELEAERYVVGVPRPPEAVVVEMTKRFSAPISFRLLEWEEYQGRRQRIQQQLQSSRNQAARRMHAREFVELRERVANSSAVRLVEELFTKALDVSATDIHMEHQESGFRVRFRVDSILQDAMFIHPELADEVTSRIKILADMDITERRQPQDGHIKVSLRGHDLNMRVATVPTYHGERISIRLINSGKIDLTLEDLGLDDHDLARIERLAQRPYGMILTTGPVGSGKTTTLYASLARLDAIEQNIITIEDPVEYELDNINQIEVNYKIKFGFVEGLRAVLRQDPNVILLGEIRDHETAAIAIRASMTGLLVFSSLHTNDAVGAVTTFHNFQVPPLLIANSLLGVIAQRLVRRLCPECKELYTPTPEELEVFAHRNMDLPEGAQLARTSGCEACYFSGYKGRVGVFEVLEITDEMRELILEKASESVLRNVALNNGMRLLSDDALRKVRNHSTSLDEVRRVVWL